MGELFSMYNNRDYRALVVSCASELTIKKSQGHKTVALVSSYCVIDYVIDITV